jgi:hypothetical protein
LLAIHIRRGDFSEHCHNLAGWSSDYNGFNKFPGLPDKFSLPQGGATPENVETYVRHCFPTIEEIVKRVMDVKNETKGRQLRGIYVMTNADGVWLEELKGALHGAGKWDRITSSKDLKLSWEQRYVSQAVDMLIGEKAQALIGNGVWKFPLSCSTAG